MCGLTGFFERGGLSSGAESVLRSMMDAIAYRGPDDSGVWLDPAAGIALGHRRLAIVDLSPNGHQPMRSACGRWMLAINGEIYNFDAMRRQLESAGWSGGWRGHSDTEVLLAAVTQWGVETALQRCVGMFAFALWDQKERRLVLARDRLGEKPLYYGVVGRALVFGSDLNAFYHHPDWAGEIDRDALALLMRHNYIPAPYSIFKGIHKVLPAHFLVFERSDLEPRQACYWDVAAVAASAQNAPFSGSPNEAVDQLDGLLRQSLQGQMMADVPLGAFLSGGIDSSLVVATMQSMTSQPVRTFSIGFNEEGFNEAVHAKGVACHLGTEHTELYVSSADALAAVPKLPDIYSEPFSDSSQIPTFLVAELARGSVTVSLSGDGGDELFSGYSRYQLADRAWSRLSRVPRVVRAGAASAMQAISLKHWDDVFRVAKRFVPSRYRPNNPGDKVHKLAGVLALKDGNALYEALVTHWPKPSSLVLGSIEPPTVLTGARQIPAFPTFVQRMMYLDLVSYLPDDILTKVDRASMAVGLETRVPLLDHRLVEFALGLPITTMRNQGQSKWILKELLYRSVPRQLVDRPKMGFGVPIDRWLRGPLRAWAADLLDSRRLKAEGYFDAAMVETAWTEHQSGGRNWQYLLWDVLMFQAWHQRYRDAIGTTRLRAAAVA